MVKWRGDERRGEGKGEKVESRGQRGREEDKRYMKRGR